MITIITIIVRVVRLVLLILAVYSACEHAPAAANKNIPDYCTNLCVANDSLRTADLCGAEIIAGSIGIAAAVILLDAGIAVPLGDVYLQPKPG